MSGKTESTSVEARLRPRRSQLQQLLVVGFDDEVDRARRLLCDRDHAFAGGDSPPRVSKTRSTGPLSTTVAPACRASWTAMCPTPPEAPVTSTRSPRASRPCANSACQAVSPPIGRAAASTWLSRKGFGASTSAGTAAYSAATPSRSKGVSAYTSSPLPTTTPESSYDGIAGNRSTGHSIQLVTGNRCRLHAHQHLARHPPTASRSPQPSSRHRVAVPSPPLPCPCCASSSGDLAICHLLFVGVAVGESAFT